LTVAGLVEQRPRVAKNPVLSFAIEHVLKGHTIRERAFSQVLGFSGYIGMNLGWDLKLRQQAPRLVKESTLPEMLPVGHIPVASEGTPERLRYHLVTGKPTVWRTKHIINEVPAR
ncbi:hypothetical protein, partial [Brevibacterium casei]|uniref:hypothetical protein n=1 Tax=Brevibacterium casei TaxID=33889 RepID=UPI001C92BA7D